MDHSLYALLQSLLRCPRMERWQEVQLQAQVSVERLADSAADALSLMADPSGDMDTQIQERKRQVSLEYSQVQITQEALGMLDEIASAKHMDWIQAMEKACQAARALSAEGLPLEWDLKEWGEQAAKVKLWSSMTRVLLEEGAPLTAVQARLWISAIAAAEKEEAISDAFRQVSLTSFFDARGFNAGRWLSSLPLAQALIAAAPPRSNAKQAGERWLKELSMAPLQHEAFSAVWGLGDESHDKLKELLPGPVDLSAMSWRFLTTLISAKASSEVVLSSIENVLRLHPQWLASGNPASTWPQTLKSVVGGPRLSDEKNLEMALCVVWEEMPTQRCWPMLKTCLGQMKQWRVGLEDMERRLGAECWPAPDRGKPRL